MGFWIAVVERSCSNFYKRQSHLVLVLGVEGKQGERPTKSAGSCFMPSKQENVGLIHHFSVCQSLCREERLVECVVLNTYLIKKSSQCQSLVTNATGSSSDKSMARKM